MVQADATASTGWETFLEAVIRAGFRRYWHLANEDRVYAKAVNEGNDTNALASSIVLVCRKRPSDAPTATRRDFVSALKAELPVGPAPIFNAATSPRSTWPKPPSAPAWRSIPALPKCSMPKGVRCPCAPRSRSINQTLDEALAEQEGDFDADSRWALAWFDQYGFGEAEYGTAETLSKAKNTSVAGMVEAGILASKSGKVRLLRPSELPADWDPTTDRRTSAWEAVHHLIRALESGGDQPTADLVSKLGSHAEIARELCYRLYTVSERRKRAADALSYNGLVQSWPEITRLARDGGTVRTPQPTLFEADDEE